MTARNPWLWIPTLYFTQGVPNVMVVTVSTILYKNLGISNTEIALYTSWLYLPWVIKPLWGPLVDLLGTKRRWIVGMQFFMGAALALVAFTLPASNFFQLSLALFWLVAFASATHDIAADGFYMLGMPNTGDQAAFVGVRSTFFRLAMITGQGALVFIAGTLAERTGNPATAWGAVLVLLGLYCAAIGAYHFWALPRPASDVPTVHRGSILRETLDVFAAFFRKPELWRIVLFLLLYRFAEAQLLRLVTPFMLDPREAGGLGLTTKDVGIVYGTVGVIALTLGGLLGGWFISRVGLKRSLLPMVLAINVPNAVYVWLALALPSSLTAVSAGIAVEQFGYGFGFAAYMVYMLMVASTDEHGRDNPHKTAHYALCTGFMALSMMLPGMWSGWLQDQLGYPNFFIWVCIATAASFAATALVKVDAGFGKKV
jgi:MFS transporter, PAT family, beta-lactamase induction signal transducer AmpG